jgi:hypothetical protein
MPLIFDDESDGHRAEDLVLHHAGPPDNAGWKQ